MTLYIDRWLLDCSGHIIRYISVKSLCCALETNIILYVNYTLIKKMFKDAFPALGWGF